MGEKELVCSYLHTVQNTVYIATCRVFRIQQLIDWAPKTNNENVVFNTEGPGNRSGQQ